MHTPFSARPLLRATAIAALWLAAGVAAHAQLQADASRITQVKVYPGSATVERVARVAAGSRSVTFACLPAGLDVQSLQVSAGAAVRVGETSVLSEARELSANCATSALDGRIRELEGQKAALQAETDALGMVTGYLKGLSGSESGPGARAPIDARNLTAVTDAMRRSGQDALLKQHQIQRRQTDLDRQLKPLLAERGRTQGQGAQVTAVTVTLAASADADVKLSYQVNGPGWTPSYRALLDTTTRKVRIERQALVAQATGEDWRGVKLVLSTGQPRRETTGRTPNAWRIGIEPPPRTNADAAYMAAPMAAAPAPIAADRKMAMERVREPLFDVSVFDNSFATEFAVPQSIDIPSNGQRVTLALGQHEDTAQLAARTSPRVDPSAFLIAEMAQPTGVWPAGPMQLYRDGNFVGQGRWNAPSDAKLTLSFGRDELVRVQVEPERDNQGSGGFAGSRAERQVQRAYVVENRHRTPIAVQVFEAAPVSVDEQVRVTTRFSPQPVDQAWNKQPGLAMWRFDLDAGQTARVSADYTIGYPKDARLQMR
ncbi:mucoidy inhibitor MuiA family protein [Variovorax paradoxus]|uniref:Mucoidy inhibitor MuiA family protein n=1 Tax=Variovorax paradoxus TaxID=34073 RepID=A0A5Q0M462_VARPD|nr:DUF4139 domain-containing protein [Variovorax paradoxus]QFZ84269.1 mucoidy inhibitor MuiA family protein [Variovorax paradoxus]